MRKLFCIVAVLACVSTAGVVCARTWFLPDYQTGELHKKGYQDRGQNNTNNSITDRTEAPNACSGYQYTDRSTGITYNDAIAEANKGTKRCNHRFQLSDTTVCWADCCQPCDTKSDYTSEYAVRNSEVASTCYDYCNTNTYYYPSGCNSTSQKSCPTNTEFCNYSFSDGDRYGCGKCGITCNDTTGYCPSKSENGYYYRDDTVTCSSNNTSVKCSICDWVTCPSGYAVDKIHCGGTISNGGYVLGSAHSTYNRCYSCDIKCNEGFHVENGSCAPDCTQTCYLNECPTGGNCHPDDCGYECLDSCKPNYCPSGNTCVPKTCSLSSAPTHSSHYQDGCGYYCCKDCIDPYKDSSSCSGNVAHGEYVVKNEDDCGCGTCEIECDSGYVLKGSTCERNCTTCSTSCGDNSICETDDCGCDGDFISCAADRYMSPSSCGSETATYSWEIINEDENDCGICSKVDKCTYSCDKSCGDNSDCTTDGCGCKEFTGCASGYYTSASSCGSDTSTYKWVIEDPDENGCGSCAKEDLCPTSCDKECGVNSYCNKDSCGCVTFDECKSGYTTDKSDCSEFEEYGTVFLNHTDKFGCGDCDVSCERPYVNSCPWGWDCAVVGGGPCYRVNGCAADYYDCETCCVPTYMIGDGALDCSRVNVWDISYGFECGY